VILTSNPHQNHNYSHASSYYFIPNISFKYYNGSTYKVNSYINTQGNIVAQNIFLTDITSNLLNLYGYNDNISGITFKVATIQSAYSSSTQRGILSVGTSYIIFNSNKNFKINTPNFYLESTANLYINGITITATSGKLRGAFESTLTDGSVILPQKSSTY
jgi:hypothetical protein